MLLLFTVVVVVVVVVVADAVTKAFGVTIAFDALIGAFVFVVFIVFGPTVSDPLAVA